MSGLATSAAPAGAAAAARSAAHDGDPLRAVEMDAMQCEASAQAQGGGGPR